MIIPLEADLRRNETEPPHCLSNFYADSEGGIGTWKNEKRWVNGAILKESNEPVFLCIQNSSVMGHFIRDVPIQFFQYRCRFRYLGFWPILHTDPIQVCCYVQYT